MIFIEKSSFWELLIISIVWQMEIFKVRIRNKGICLRFYYIVERLIYFAKMTVCTKRIFDIFDIAILYFARKSLTNLLLWNCGVLLL